MHDTLQSHNCEYSNQGTYIFSEGTYNSCIPFIVDAK